MAKKSHSVLFKMFLFTLLATLWGLTEWRGMAGASMGNEPDVILQKQDRGKEITAKTGQVIEVQLEGLGGAGDYPN